MRLVPRSIMTNSAFCIFHAQVTFYIRVSIIYLNTLLFEKMVLLPSFLVFIVCVLRQEGLFS